MVEKKRIFSKEVLRLIYFNMYFTLILLSASLLRGSMIKLKLIKELK